MGFSSINAADNIYDPAEFLIRSLEDILEWTFGPGCEYTYI